MNIETDQGSDVLAGQREGLNMDRVRIFNLITLAVTFLALVPKMESQIPFLPVPPVALHPLCASQLALANYACSILPINPRPPPSPLTPPPPPSPSPPLPGDGDEGQRHLRHKHMHRHRHGQTAQENYCCRWAKEVDNECVCEILVHLPPTLARPKHTYSLMIGESCIITYTCGGAV